MQKEITDVMINEFNAAMKVNGTIIRLERENGIGDNCIKIVPNSTMFISSYIINPTKQFYKMLEEFFKNYDIEFSYNNDGSIFWSKYN